jgi:hypothetical protein
VAGAATVSNAMVVRMVLIMNWSALFAFRESRVPTALQIACQLQQKVNYI